MNKFVAGAVAGLALGAMSAASALDLGLDMSVGGGAFFANDFGGGISTPEVTFLGITVTEKADIKYPWTGIGIRAFFDATYGEAGLSLTFCGGEVDDEYKSKRSFTNFGFSVLGKYPVALSDQMTVFPLLGFDFVTVLSGSSKYGNSDPVKWVDPGDNGKIWFKFGGGLDYALNDKMYLRIPILYGIGFASKAENDAAKMFKNTLPSILGNIDDAKILLSHGLTIGVNVGYRL